MLVFYGLNFDHR